MDLLWSVAFLCAILAGIFIYLLRGILAIPASSMDADFLASFSASKFRPLLRLLDEEDYRFLRLQPGYRPEMERRLRAGRRQVFLLYLKELRHDFLRLHRAARILLLNSPVDQPGLSAEIVRQGIAFQVAFARVRFLLALNRLGLSGVDVRSLVQSLEWMQQQIRVLGVAQLQRSAS